MNYTKDISINEFALDEEWVKHSTVYMRYAEKAAEADSKKKKAKEKLEVIKAELSLEYRENPPEGVKISNPVVDDLVKVDESYKKAVKEYMDADYEHSIISSAVRALEQKKSALENLVKLHLGGYFSEPKQQKLDDYEEDPSYIEDSIDEKQRQRLNKRRRGNASDNIE